MDDRHVFLATRNPTIPAACRTFALTGVTKASGDDVRAHWLRSWHLHLCAFDDEETAELWTEATVVSDETALPPLLPFPSPSAFASPPPLLVASAYPLRSNANLPPFPPVCGTLVRVCVAGVESVVDLADPLSAANFFMSIGGTATRKEVLVSGLPHLQCSFTTKQVVAPSTRCPPALDQVVTVPPREDKRRRLTISVVPLSSKVPPSSADHHDAIGAGSGQPRKHVAWACAGSVAGRLCGHAVKEDIAARLPVTSVPGIVALPSYLDGEALRVCRLLSAQQRVFLTRPPGCDKTHVAYLCYQLAISHE